MKCPHCNWQNPATYTHCFNCNAPLMAEAAPASSGRFERRQHPQPGHAATAPAHEPSTLAMAEPDALKRVAATIIDALLLGVALIAIAAAGLFALQSPALASAGLTAVALIVVLALLLPFGVLGGLDATGGTPGKRLLGLQVRNAAGQMPGVMPSTFRQLLKYVTNLGLPFVFHLADRFLFGYEGAHNVITGNYVVRRSADPGKISRFIQANEARRAGTRRFGGMLVLGLFSVLLTLIVIAMAQGEIRDARHPQAAEARKAMGDIARSFKPITQLATAHYTRTGRFAGDMQELGVNALPNGISALQFDTSNGAIIATLSTDAGEARVQGKHLAWLPVFKQRSGSSELKSSELKKWRCGSPDIPKAELPSLCNDDMSALAAPAS